ncbi:putative phage tail protein [Ensifer adhaerens OV14]|nr:putative phage tail protein [Ensifer adhaerens OV14]
MASAVIGSLRVVLGIDTAMFDKGLGDAMKSLKGVGSSMQSLGKTMSLSLTAPIVGFGALTVKTAGDFEAAMNRVDAATGATADEFKAMRDMAVQLGADTSFSASESADAMEMLAKNGLKASQILDGAVAASMQLAAASGSDLSAAADVATDVMMNFGKEAKDLAPLVDGITGVLLESKFGFDDYRLAMGQAGGVAGNLGVSFEDFNAVIAGTSSAFASGSDAGTSFKTFLTTLVPKSDAAAAAMDELGLKFFNVDGSMKSMTAIAEELKTKMGGLSDEDMNNKMSTMFGTDAMRTAIMLMKTGGAGIDELKTKIGSASAEEQAAARLKGFNGELEKLGGAFETLQIAIADSGLLAMVTSFVTMLAGWIDALATSNPELLKWGTILAGLAAVLGPLLITLGAIASAIAAVGLPIAAVVAGLGLLTSAVIAFWPEIQAAWEWVKKLVDIFVQLHTQALVAVIAKFQELRTSIVAALAGLGEEILATFRALPAQMIQIGGDIISGLWQGIQNKWEELKGGVADIASGIKDTFTGFFDINSPSRVMAEIGQFIMQGLGLGMESMQGDVVGVAGGVAGGIKTAFDGIKDVGAGVGQGINGMFDGIGSSLAQAIKGTKDWRDVAIDALSSIGSSLLQTMNFGGGFGGGLLKGLLGGLVGFANGGSILPGGAGGIDSQVVAFRKSPTEQVDIYDPRKGSRGGGAYAPVYNIDARGADQAAVARLERGLVERDRTESQRAAGYRHTATTRGTRA